MTDTFSKEKRSEIMRAVKSKGNKSTELKVISLFKSNGIIGWRRNYKLYGKPDFVFPAKKIVVFADGCFWHGHSCRNLKPSANKEYWNQKIKKNIKRDREVNSILKSKNWTVFRIWECQIKKGKLPIKLVKLLA